MGFLQNEQSNHIRQAYKSLKEKNLRTFLKLLKGEYGSNIDPLTELRRVLLKRMTVEQIQKGQYHQYALNIKTIAHKAYEELEVPGERHEQLDQVLVVVALLTAMPPEMTEQVLKTDEDAWTVEKVVEAAMRIYHAEKAGKLSMDNTVPVQAVTTRSGAGGDRNPQAQRGRGRGRGRAPRRGGHGPPRASRYRETSESPKPEGRKQLALPAPSRSPSPPAWRKEMKTRSENQSDAYRVHHKSYQQENHYGFRCYKCGDPNHTKARCPN